MLFSRAEYAEYVAPFLKHEHPSPSDAVAWLAFSHLCEPSDLLPNYLSQFVTPAELIERLIERASASDVAGLVGTVGVRDLEEDLGLPFGKIWSNATERWYPRLSKTSVIESLQWMLKNNASDTPKSLVIRGGDDFPLGLEDLRAHQPFALWASGSVDLLELPAVSIVGTRQASGYGADVARDLAAVAAMHSLVTISGGAYGIDAIIHESALALDSPTIALMAGGLANLYPKNNLGVIQEIERRGLVLAELPPSVSPAKWRFLMRNRLIAALGQATVVVEAGRTSGALNTAGSAVGLGRVCAIVPGSVGSARSVGCHDFLNEHLGHVQILARAQDLPALVGIQTQNAVSVDSIGVLEKRALDTFGKKPLESWEIQRLAGLTVRETQIALGSLELLGLLERNGSRYQRTG